MFPSSNYPSLVRSALSHPMELALMEVLAVVTTSCGVLGDTGI